MCERKCEKKRKSRRKRRVGERRKNKLGKMRAVGGLCDVG
jgi:hypothetical protein